MTKSAAIDWEKIEAEYRAGIKSSREIADEHGISHVGINKRAKREGWPRDLAAKIRAKAKAKVTRASVTSKVTKVAENDIVEAESEIQSRIELSHRKDVPRKRELCDRLFAEIEALTDNQDLIKQVRSALASDDKPALSKAVARIASLAGRIKGMSDLVTSYRTLVLLERQIFGIDESRQGEDFPQTIERVIVRPDNNG